MKTLAEFIKSTLIGGLLVVVPLYLCLLLLAKTALALLALIDPITARIPASVEFRGIVAGLIIAFVCFIAGLVVRTGPGLRAEIAFENAVLKKLPGYTLLRGLAGRMTGQADEPTLTPALAEIEEALVPALIVEALEDKSYTVLVPSVPTPLTGAIYVLPPERVHPVDLPFAKVLAIFTKWGAGTGDMVRAMERGKASSLAAPRA